MTILAENITYMRIITIAKELGTDLRTRSFFRRDIDALLTHVQSIVMDFAGVVFVSRSVADEIFNVLEDYPNVSILHMEGDVEMMFAVVKNGRSTPRKYNDLNTSSVQLKTMDELQSFFSKM